MSDTTNIITAADINGFIGAIPNPPVNSLNFLLQSYGLPTLTLVTTGTDISPDTFVDMIDAINYIAQHQGTTITEIQVDPTIGTPTGLIGLESPNLYKAVIASNIALISANRLNTALRESITTEVTTNSELWYHNLVFTHVITFNSGDEAKYFFNTGGQISINFEHPTESGVNSLWNQLATACGKIYISSTNDPRQIRIEGTRFNGVTKINGSGTPTTLSANHGYYALTVNDTEIFKQFATVGNLDYLQSNIAVKVKSNGTRGSRNDAGNIITVTTTFTQVPMATLVAGGYAIPGTTVTATALAPYGINAQNTWGTPTVEGMVQPDLNVSYPNPVVVSSWNPNPVSINESSTLSWAATNATSVTLGTTGLENYETTGTKSYSDFIKLTDTKSSNPTFNETITAAGPAGRTIIAAPLRLFVPTPESVTPSFTIASFSETKLNARKSCVLTWATQNAVRVSVVSTELSVNSSGLSGSVKVVAPNIPGIYTAYLTATSNTDDVVTQQVQIEVIAVATVTPKIIASLTPSTNILPGQAVTLSWNILDSTSATIDSTELNLHRSVLSGSEIIIAPETPGSTYPIVVTAVSESLDTATLQLAVTVTKLPIINCSANKYKVSPNQPVTFIWDTIDAVSVTVTGLFTSEALSGSETITTNAQLGTQSVTITATSSTNESVTKTIDIVVIEPDVITPVINGNFNPGTVVAGEATTLTWMTYYADRVKVTGLHNSTELNGSLSIVPTAAFGKQSVVITAYGNAGQSTSTNFEVTVTAPTPIIPSITGSFIANTIAVGQQANFNWLSTDAVSVTLTGLGTNSTELSGETYTTVATKLGTEYVLLTATSSTGHTVTNKVPLTIVAPSILLGPNTMRRASATLSPLTFAVPYIVQLTASGGTAPYQFAVVNSMLPAGLILDSATGIIAGTPTTTALTQFAFAVQATDNYGFVGTQSYELNAQAPRLTLTPVTLSVAKVNQSYTAQTISAAGGTAPYEFIFPTDGNFPSGLRLSNNTSNSVDIVGTPNLIGDYRFPVTAVDSYGFSVTQIMNINVTAVDIAVRPTRIVLSSGLAKTVYTSETITASGGRLPYIFVMAMGTQLPRGLSLIAITPDSAVITGTPERADSTPVAANFVIDVVDSNNNRTSKNYSITITNPVITLSYPTRLLSGSTMSPYSDTVTASGGTAPYVFTVKPGTQLPTGLSITSSVSTGTISGIPLDAGAFYFTIVATDANGFTTEQEYSISLEVMVVVDLTVPLE